MELSNSVPQTALETAIWVKNILKCSPLPNAGKKAVELGIKIHEKSPSSYDGRKVIPVKWSQYQTELPSDKQIEEWFKFTQGVGAIGQYNGEHWIAWIDFDKKNFKESDDELDNTLQTWEEKFPILKSCHKFKSPSGGYRYLIALHDQPDKCNAGFSLDENGEKHAGEVLTKNGGFTVLPPTIMPHGEYVWIRWSEEYPPVVQNLASIGIYQKKKAQKQNIPQPKAAVELTFDNAGVSSNQSELSAVIDEINSKLDFETAFNQYPHDFQHDRDNKVRGNCPWHESKSGTAFYAVRENNRLLFRCPACDIGGDIIGYRSLMQRGILKPKGKDFVDIVKELCEETGITFPEKARKNPQSESPSHATPVTEVQPINDPNRVKSTCEATIWEVLFEKGKGNWTVLNDAFYKFEETGGYWKFIPDNVVHKEVSEKLLGLYQLQGSGENEKKSYKFGTDSNKQSSFKFNRSLLTKVDDTTNTHLLCFLNGTVDVRTGDLQTHLKENFLTFRIASNYIPNANCPQVFKDFINSAFGAEYLPLVREIIAMYVDPSAPYGKFVHLIGDSGSGKGTFIRFIGSLFGEFMRSLNNFADISTPEGRHQNMHGSRLISFPDMGGFQGNLRAFYELVDNGSLSGRALFSSSSYERRWGVRFILASCDFLPIENSGDGWDRRCIPLPTKPLNGRKADPELGRKLEECTAEVISWALAVPRTERYKLILENNIGNTQIARMKREQSLYSDPIKAFIDQCLIPKEETNVDKGMGLNVPQLHSWYSAYCKGNGNIPMGERKFNSHAKKILSRNYQEGYLKREGKEVNRIPAIYRCLEKAHPKLFEQLDNPHQPGEKHWYYRKEHTQECGLEMIEEFWRSKSEGFSNPPENLVSNDAAYSKPPGGEVSNVPNDASDCNNTDNSVKVKPSISNTPDISGINKGGVVTDVTSSKSEPKITVTPETQQQQQLQPTVTCNNCNKQEMKFPEQKGGGEKRSQLSTILRTGEKIVEKLDIWEGSPSQNLLHVTEAGNTSPAMDTAVTVPKTGLVTAVTVENDFSGLQADKGFQENDCNRNFEESFVADPEVEEIEDSDSQQARRFFPYDQLRDALVDWVFHDGFTEEQLLELEGTREYGAIVSVQYMVENELDTDANIKATLAENYVTTIGLMDWMKRHGNSPEPKKAKKTEVCFDQDLNVGDEVKVLNEHHWDSGVIATIIDVSGGRIKCQHKIGRDLHKFFAVPSDLLLLKRYR